ncbi:hypothetical protein [Maribacter sp. MAR_2009_72]|uniref:hypothetical protein n=1 Tax=Maribacter sp. MAR_2009_72 TaxID=1250050 RepID=UPI0011A51E86|nr:hypothetical protein [Maribacter sp. MAR_2009_72]
MNKIIWVTFFIFSIKTFSQGSNEPVWWEMDRKGNHLEVASYLLYKVQSDSTRNKHAEYLHIARAYGYLNDYEKASFYWKKSIEENAQSLDEQFWWYHKGTLAFFERNRNELLKYCILLKNNHSNYYANNAKLLEALYANFDKGYEEACNLAH